jgi:CHASE3 domain sensor protein
MKITSKLNLKVQLAFGSAILIMLIVGTISYRVVVLSNESDRLVRHTHEVLENLANLRAGMERLESGARGFILLGKELYVDSYHAGIASATEHIATLRSLTQDNPKQQPRLNDLEAQIASKVKLADQYIALRRTKGLEIAAAQAVAVGSIPGQRIMADFRATVGQMNDEETRLLLLRDAESTRRSRQAKTVLIIGTCLGLFIAGAAGWSVDRHNTQRGLAEAALRRSEENCRTLLDGVQDYAIVRLDTRGQLVTWNVGAERMMDCSADQLANRSFSSFFSPKDIRQGKPRWPSRSVPESNWWRCGRTAPSFPSRLCSAPWKVTKKSS